MRRALVLASMFASALLAIGSAAASAAEIEREVGFELQVEGFDVDVFVTNNDGDVSAMLILVKGPQVAYYQVPAKVTAERVTARFGAFGELDYTFRPKGKGSLECLGASNTENEAVLEGTFTFTGEEEYVHIDARRAEGAVHLYPVPKQCAQTRRGRRVVPYHPTYSDKGATLQAKTGLLDDGTAYEVSVYDGGDPRRHQIGIFAYFAERQEGVEIARGVQMSAPSSAFHWNLAAGTASLHPPAPFTGSAKFTRRGHDGHGTWTGSLAMPILGGEPVKVAGSAFSAFMHKGTPQDE
ncbi:MAG TPA: hypothetical protein VN522_00775 [Solirubrobacterales bacterium]|nr:hypothetical protein [Solirubrobacterales bacterium]